MATSKNGAKTLRNEDYSDRELLHVVNDCANGDGHASTYDVADRLGRDVENRREMSSVASRLAAMVRYGFLARNHEGGWRPTNVGFDLMAGKLSKGVSNALDRMSPGEQVLMMREITQRAYVAATPSVATAVRREYLHNAAQRVRETRRKRRS